MSRGQIMMRMATVLAAVLAFTATAAGAETVISVTQTTYDNNNRPTCTTVRMNPATYDNAGQVSQVDEAYGTRDCQEFRVWACIMGAKETDSHGTQERASNP